jgi:hypothetical protein
MSCSRSQGRVLPGFLAVAMCQSFVEMANGWVPGRIASLVSWHTRCQRRRGTDRLTAALRSLRSASICASCMLSIFGDVAAAIEDGRRCNSVRGMRREHRLRRGMIAGQKLGFWGCSRVGREFRDHLKVVRKQSRNAPQVGGRCRAMVRGNGAMSGCVKKR